MDERLPPVVVNVDELPCHACQSVECACRTTDEIDRPRSRSAHGHSLLDRYRGAWPPLRMHEFLAVSREQIYIQLIYDIYNFLFPPRCRVQYVTNF